MKDVEDLMAVVGSPETDGSGLAPIPSQLDGEIAKLVRLLAKSDPDRRPELLSRMTPRHGWAFISLAERMASYAVRTASREAIRDGVQALAIGSRIITYFKEWLPIVSLLYRSVEKLGWDVQILLDDATAFGDEEFTGVVRRFLARNEANRGIAVMGYDESQDQDGFIYKRTW